MAHATAAAITHEEIHALRLVITHVKIPVKLLDKNQLEHVKFILIEIVLNGVANAASFSFLQSHGQSFEAQESDSLIWMPSI